MADAPASSSKFGFLARKIGPVPIWLIALGLVAAFYWYENFGPGASSGSSAAAAADPAVDPDTGDLYAAELAAAEQQISDLEGSAGTTDGTGTGDGSGDGTGTGTGDGGNDPVTPVTPVTPVGGGTTTGTTYVRETAPGGQTLENWALSHGTTGKGVSNATAEAHKLNLIDAANWSKWQAYVDKGYKNNMPKGLVFYVSKKAANTTTKTITSTTSSAVQAAANTANPQGASRWRTAA